MDQLTGQTAVVTGATGGVGRAVAAKLLAHGATVVLVGRSDAALERTISDSGWRAAPAMGFAVDLAVDSEVRSLMERIERSVPRIDILVHAAGVISMGPVGGTSIAELDKQYQVNLRAPYQLTQALLPKLVSCSGQVVFINSTAGRQARAGVSQYAATKYALRALADSFRDEVNPQGVRVMSVFLGRTATAMQAAVHAHEGRPYDPSRLLQADDVATLILAALQLPRTAEVTDLYVRPMLKLSS